MHQLSEYASVVLDRMEWDRRYDSPELHGFVPDTTIEGLRDIMHELWIHRCVERVGYSGWRRHQSTPPHSSHPVSSETHAVHPEDLFDHATFPDFFK
jgi:hypothetical protein